ncbi:hypothetical protein EDP1_3989 [Pseudomonas putida S610]|nr:hypothetical protein EDP1_3989 [Pseudomonas putida S610]
MSSKCLIGASAAAAATAPEQGLVISAGSFSPATCSALASGTTARALSRAPDKSMTVQPACTAWVAKLRLTAAPAAKNASLTCAKSNPSTSRTLSFLPANITLLPADSMLASRCRVATGKSSSSRIWTNASPTLPVAPTTAISNDGFILQAASGETGAALYPHYTTEANAGPLQVVASCLCTASCLVPPATFTARPKIKKNPR